ncbi:hypothetical protein KY290_007974 [Solanum tuberosum]|uniref:Uncharacterized protein n=1 Tax=Solanum tuberosum TaxID=4113 RepID=A0ABQ7W8X6_SOLTU|nr:hypothetical protein KY290_007974 [Solanum tuberosum]
MKHQTLYNFHPFSPFPKRAQPLISSSPLRPADRRTPFLLPSLISSVPLLSSLLLPHLLLYFATPTSSNESSGGQQLDKSSWSPSLVFSTLFSGGQQLDGNSQQPGETTSATEEAQHLKKLIQDYIASFIKVGDKVGASKFLKFKYNCFQ